MNLYMIRHAEAAPLGEGGVTDDADRPLTEVGNDQCRKLAAAIQQHGISLGVVLTSPLLRARRTAELVLQNGSQPAPELRTCEELEPGSKRRKLARVIEAIQGQAVTLVGHEPDLGEFTAWLIGSKKTQIEYAKAAIAYVSCEEDVRKGSGTLHWLVPPEWLA